MCVHHTILAAEHCRCNSTQVLKELRVLAARCVSSGGISVEAYNLAPVTLQVQERSEHLDAILICTNCLDSERGTAEMAGVCSTEPRLLS